MHLAIHLSNLLASNQFVSSLHQDYDGKQDRFEFTKPLMAQADRDRRFYRTIH